MSGVDATDNRAARALAAEEFSFTDAVGGWRGFVESVLPGLVFVVTFVIWGGFRIPVIAAVATVVVMVVARLIQRTPTTQALSGSLGVAVGAYFAWRAGDATEYFVPGFFLAGGYGLAMLVSVLVRWPVVGIVLGLIRGWGTKWRADPRAMRRLQLATGVFAASQLLKLAIQLPMYFAGATAVLGTTRLVMGVPYFALTLWVIWLMVRNVELAPEPEDLRPQT